MTGHMTSGNFPTGAASGAKRLVGESFLGNAFRNWASLRLARRDAAATRLAASRNNRLVLNTRSSGDLLQPGSGNTLFILGSGESINTLTKSNWSEIGAGFSVGVNSWPIHPFVPDIYAFEAQESAQYAHEAMVLRNLLARRLSSSPKPQILHLRPHKWTRPEWEILPPVGWRGDFFYYGRTTPATHLLRNLRRDISALILAQRSGSLPGEILLDSGGSIGRMVSLGIFLGFQKIVLTGVDLKRNRYFFEDFPGYFEELGIETYDPWKSRTEQHETQQRTNRAFIATEFLAALAAASSRLGGPEIMVASQHSLLSSVLPQFKWGEIIEPGTQSTFTA